VAEPVIFDGRGLPLGDFGQDYLHDLGCRKSLARGLSSSKPCPRGGEVLAGIRSHLGLALRRGGVNRLGVTDGC